MYARASRNRYDASDSGVCACQSAVVRGIPYFSGAYDQTSSCSGVPESPSSRFTSRSPKRATASASKPANAARKFSRLRRIVSLREMRVNIEGLVLLPGDSQAA